MDGYKLEKVLKYKYLGNIIEASGKFHTSHMELSKKGTKVLFSLFKYLNNIENIPINIQKKLFVNESLIKPMLMCKKKRYLARFYWCFCQR